MTKRLVDGTVKTLAACLFTPDAHKIESYMITKRLLRLATASALKTTLAERSKISLLMFDLDGTLIRTRSGKLFAKDPNDWCWLFQDGIRKIRDSVQDGDTLCVIVSNQAVKVSIDVIQERFRQVMVAIKIPMIAMAALDKDQYRKPDIGMWEYLVDYLKTHFKISIDKESSLFVGDAAGRLQSGRDNKPDFSYTDRAFAFNIGVKFQTPEEYFQGQEPTPFIMPDSSRFLKNDPESLDEVLEKIKNDRPKQEIVLLVGWPGCGKSTFCSKYLSSYVAINQDILKSHSKCMKLGVQALHQGKSICIDSTNYRKSTRLDWVKISRRPEINCPVRVLQFDIDRALAQHMNCVRHARAVRAGKFDSKVPDVAYHTYAKYYVAPSLDEGYHEIMQVPFVAEFETNEEEILFKRIY